MRVAPRPSRRKARAARPASRGVAPNTAECIFTPAGMPSEVGVSPMASRMSRAVPSPPAKRRRSTPCRAISRAAVRVSPAVVDAVARSTTTVGEKPAARASCSPMSAGHVRMRTSPAPDARTLSASTVRAGASCGAPSWRARASAASPSVPFSPTRPPMPAMGLTIRPTLIMGSPRRECTTPPHHPGFRLSPE